MMSNLGVGVIKWKFPEVLQHHNLRPRDVETEAIKLGYTFGRNTIYRLLKEDGPVNVNRDSLAAVIASLRSLTKQPIKVQDILEYEED